jgi:hypothetical protein
MNPLVEAFLQAAAPIALQAAQQGIGAGLAHLQANNHPKTVETIQSVAAYLNAFLSLIEHANAVTPPAPAPTPAPGA